MPFSRVAPLRGHVEVVEREPDRIHEAVAGVARRVRAVHLHPLARRQHACRSSTPPVSSSAGMSGGGGGGGVPISTSITHLPRSTGEVRLASDVCTSTLPWPSRPRRVSSGYWTRRNSVPDDARGCRSAAPVARSRRCSRRDEQIEQAAVLAHQVVEEQLGLASHRGGEVVVEVRDRSSDRDGPCRRPAAAATARQSGSRAPSRADRRASGAPASRARPAPRAGSASPASAVPDRAARPRGRTRGATRGRRRRRGRCRPAARLRGSFSRRKMKCGLARIASSAPRTPPSKPPFAVPFS